MSNSIFNHFPKVIDEYVDGEDCMPDGFRNIPNELLKEHHMTNLLDPRLVKAFQEQNGFALDEHLHLLATIGSHSHGTHISKNDSAGIDDTDFMGLVIPPTNRVLGLSTWEHWTWKFEELDVVLYSMQKAVKLLLKGNPNILGLLWLRPQDYVMTTPIGDSLISNREIFSSQDAYHAFIGYAHGQLKRMTALDEDRMKEYEFLKSFIADLGTDVETVLRADANKLKYLAGNTANNKFTNEDTATLGRLQQFRALHKNYFSGYMGEKRKNNVRQFGYDVKNASHLIRLLRMGIEFLNTGRLNVFRTRDASELMAIKRGEWTLEQVREKADRLFELASLAKTNSILPAQASYAAAEQWLVGVMQDQMIGPFNEVRSKY